MYIYKHNIIMLYGFSFLLKKEKQFVRVYGKKKTNNNSIEII